MRLAVDSRACIVTGASRGIGRATAELLCREGAHVLLVARHAEDLDEAVDACRELGGRAVPATLDVTSEGAAEQLADLCAAEFGRIDVLVNNAGTSSVRSLDELTDDDWLAQWEVNVMAPMRLTRAIAPRMVESGGGRIVNVCSSAGRRPSSTNAAYSVTKAAELALTRGLAAEYADQGVRINAVAPGPTASDLWLAPEGLLDQTAGRKGVPRDQALSDAADRIPLKRFGTVEEVASVIALLCSEEVAPSGAIWPVDGGHVSGTIS
ncbi:MAG TPA: SDR family oxidoreductase [Thermoleophilaceae bacterium]|nr:SDR family oxidoreductase [Thermoleophilaceae bacterium]